MDKQDAAMEWFQIAYEDLDSAQFLFDHKHPKPLEIICYHCQQSAEKSLKGYLCAQGIEVPKTHEVGLICRRCTEFCPAFADYFDACDELTMYATHTRYPNRIEVEEHDARRVLRWATSLYNLALEQCQQFGQVLADEPEQSGPTMRM